MYLECIKCSLSVLFTLCFLCPEEYLASCRPSDMKTKNHSKILLSLHLDKEYMNT